MSERSVVELPPEVASRSRSSSTASRSGRARLPRSRAGSSSSSGTLAREGRLGFWRWLSLFLGIAGTYRQNDSVDVVYDAAGRREVASLAIESTATRSPS